MNMTSLDRMVFTRRRASSIQQPVHRRPFYGKTTKSLNAQINGRSTARTPLVDHGMDNFSYDPDHLAKFRMPEGLAPMLGEELLCQSQLWQIAAAALETSLERIENFSHAAEGYAYPAAPHPSRLRSASELNFASPGSETPPSMLASPQSEIPAATAPMDKISFLQLTAQSPVGMESPPMTPSDSFSSVTPSFQGEAHKAENMLPALMRISSQLSAMSTTDTIPEDATTPPLFDEISWETYTRKYQQQLADVQEARKRMLGYGRKINTLCRELAFEKKDITMSTLVEFMQWWGPMERVSAQVLQTKVDRLEMPDYSDNVRAE